MSTTMWALMCAAAVVSVNAMPQQEERLIRQERRFENSETYQHIIRYEDDDIDQDVDDELHVYATVLDDDEKPIHRGLVPQLWPNYTETALPPAEEQSCNAARLKCAYRAGCGLALQNYLLGCSDLAEGKTTQCNTHCRHSLIALMSTIEGQRLMKCDCEGDSFCESSKTNIRPCQSEVLYATQEDTVVTCTAAQWICAADVMCSTALDYYNRFCQSMMRGGRCTQRCKNSINILQRQTAARKLETCQCDGSEDYDCKAIKTNMQRLCFDEYPEMTNEIDDGPPSKSSSIRTRVHRFLVIVAVIASMLFGAVSLAVQSLFQSSEA